ncbi:MAG: hypothetical protein KDD78_02980, partial [Caldilineaceae bacterium]|nr:hypothetical protein [Caldilineaceae bacterium]
MATSQFQTADLTCPDCRRIFSAPIWLLVDGQERPDLLAQAQAGTLHDLACPQCGRTWGVDAPLLLYRPGQEPLIIVSPAQQTTREQDQEQANGLLSMLATALGPTWQDAWLAAIQTVPRQLLPAALSSPGVPPQLADDLQAILGELSQPARRTDMPRRIELCRRALSLVNRGQQSSLWAALQGELGNSLAQSLRGERAENL